MAVFYQEKPKKDTLKPFIAKAVELDLHGRGVAKAEGRTWFIPNLLPGEEAKVLPDRTKGASGSAQVLKLITASPLRRAPDCPHQQLCGGCALQYMPPKLALEGKVSAIARLIKKNCGLSLGAPEFVEAGAELAYRRACRLAVRGSHGRTELGFRGAASHELAALQTCPVLTARLNALLPKLCLLVNKLKARKQLGHLECVDSDGVPGVLLRFTAKLSEEDKEVLRAFGREQGCLVSAVEPGEHPITHDEILTESVLTDNAAEFYLISGSCRLFFKPSAFVQVNKDINERMVQRVCAALPQTEGLKVLDLFCGLGNFAFALAQRGAQVFGVDVVQSMIDEARDNAQRCGLQAQFAAANLEESFERQRWAKDHYDAVVLDPGRQGAKRAVRFLSELKAPLIVMISCNPLAASRDSAVLLQAGYRLKTWGVFDMFPRTAHIELMLVFALQE